MAHHQKYVSEWDYEDVASWLCSINLSQLITTFERNEISGTTLLSINDAFMKETLRMNKPAEITALRGALAALTQQDQIASRKGIKTLPKTLSSNVQRNPRDRAESAGAEAKPPTSPRILAGKRTLDTGAKEPQLLIAPARQLLDDHCTHSGWIRKQGGNHRSCELLTCYALGRAPFIIFFSFCNPSWVWFCGSVSLGRYVYIHFGF